MAATDVAPRPRPAAPAPPRAGKRLRALACAGLRGARGERLRALPRARLSDAARALALPRRVRAAPDHRDLGQSLRRRLDRIVPARPPGAVRPAPAAQLDVG